MQVLDAFKSENNGSKLVITCRDRAVLKEHILEPGILEVSGLSDEHAMQLFSHYAFHEFDATCDMNNGDRGASSSGNCHGLCGLPWVWRLLVNICEGKTSLTKKSV